MNEYSVSDDFQAKVSTSLGLIDLLLQLIKKAGWSDQLRLVLNRELLRLDTLLLLSSGKDQTLRQLQKRLQQMNQQLHLGQHKAWPILLLRVQKAIQHLGVILNIADTPRVDSQPFFAKLLQVYLYRQTFSIHTFYSALFVSEFLAEAEQIIADTHLNQFLWSSISCRSQFTAHLMKSLVPRKGVLSLWGRSLITDMSSYNEKTLPCNKLTKEAIYQLCIYLVYSQHKNVFLVDEGENSVRVVYAKNEFSEKEVNDFFSRYLDVVSAPSPIQQKQLMAKNNLAQQKYQLLDRSFSQSKTAVIFSGTGRDWSQMIKFDIALLTGLDDIDRKELLRVCSQNINITLIFCLDELLNDQKLLQVYREIGQFSKVKRGLFSKGQDQMQELMAWSEDSEVLLLGGSWVDLKIDSRGGNQTSQFRFFKQKWSEIIAYKVNDFSYCSKLLGLGCDYLWIDVDLSKVLSNVESFSY